MKGRYWNYEENKPEPKLVKFLDEKADSVRKRIKEATGVSVDPIYYSAGFKEDGEEQQQPYNLAKLLYYIVKRTPKKKRLVISRNINQDADVWKDNDELKDYTKEVRKGFIESVMDGVEKGADIGEEIGDIVGLGEVGRAVGGFIGGAIEVAKGIGGFIGGIFGW